MKLNKKGMTMVEIMASVALISIVLIFLMNLFLNIRTVYNQSKIQAEYEVLNSNIIKAVSSDIEKYGLSSIEYIDTYKSIKLTYNSYRETNLSENIVKVLKVYFQNNHYYISYGYDSNFTRYITASERVTNVVRQLPEDAILDTKNHKYLNFDNRVTLSGRKAVEIKIPLSDSYGNIYDINIYGIL